VRDGRVADVRLVRRVVQDDGAALARVVDPLLERRARHDRAGRVVGIAEVDEVDGPVRQAGQEAVVRGAGKVDDPIEASGGVGGAGAAGHDVAVQVDRIDRIGQRDHAVGREDLLDVGDVGLRAVADDDLVGGDLHAALAEVVAGDRLEEEIPAGLGWIPAECLDPRHLVHGGVHRLDH
jgi:hypothetical protein